MAFIGFHTLARSKIKQRKSKAISSPQGHFMHRHMYFLPALTGVKTQAAWWMIRVHCRLLQRTLSFFTSCCWLRKSWFALHCTQAAVWIMDYVFAVHFPLAGCGIVTWMEQFNRSSFRSTTYILQKKERMWIWMLIRDLKRKHSKSTDQLGQHATVRVFLKSNEVQISQLSIVCQKWKASYLKIILNHHTDTKDTWW